MRLMLVRIGLLLLALMVALPVAAGIQKYKQAVQAEFEAQPTEPDPPVPDTVMVAMRDGTRLATDVYTPEGEGPWPVILLRTPYDKSNTGHVAERSTRNGYVVVAQDVRGRFASEGDNLPFLADGWDELQDGYDTIVWLGIQPWCDGNIGTYGASALGITQNLMAPTQPPGLRCQHIRVAASSMFHQAAYQGGALRQSQVLGWLRGNGFDEAALELFCEHDTYDEFWQQLNIAEQAERITAPAVHIGGWFDTFLQGTIDSFTIRQHRGGEGARGNQRLIIGPWEHGESGRRKVDELQFHHNAREVPWPGMLAWFDYWLKAEDNGVLDQPPVTYYVMGDVDEPGAPGNEWRFADDWPVPANETNFYLRDGGLLALRQFADEQPDSFTFDPANPVPTVGGRNLIIPAGVFDQREIEDRGDVLVYSTEPLNITVEVTGLVSCRVWVSSDALDTDIAVRLCDVYPDGRSMLIADGILRLSCREGFEQRVPLVPGEVYEIEVDLWSTSIVFNKGHRIRLSVAGSNTPRWDINPGTGLKWEEGGEYVVQHTTVYHDQRHPSALILPVIES